MSTFTTFAKKALDGNDMWDALSKGSDGKIPAKDKAVAILMDSIIKSAAVRTAFKATMMGTSAFSVLKNQRLNGKGDTSALGQLSSGASKYAFGSVLSLLTVAFTTDSGMLSALIQVAPGTASFYDVWQKALIEPNIEGIPISTPSVVTGREIDVGEQPMIVQSSAQKQYWTDNAVPHLKTWSLDGFLKAQLVLDRFYVAKPSLRMQADYLDICATSRRPVLFKDNRGDFRFVQITSLHTEEVAEYNNAIKITIQLKEYKPFEVDFLSSQTKVASKDPSVMGEKAGTL